MAFSSRKFFYFFVFFVVGLLSTYLTVYNLKIKPKFLQNKDGEFDYIKTVTFSIAVGFGAGLLGLLIGSMTKGSEDEVPLLKMRRPYYMI